MPNFQKAKIVDSAEPVDLTPYLKFLEAMEIGYKVQVPLEKGETTRKAMRLFNRAAKTIGKRLGRMSSDSSTAAFRILPLEKRSSNISEDALRARVEKAKATRARRMSAKAVVAPVPAADTAVDTADMAQRRYLADKNNPHIADAIAAIEAMER